MACDLKKEGRDVCGERGVGGERISQLGWRL